MSGQSIALATKGIICKAGDRIIKCFIPFNLQLITDLFNLNLKLQDRFNLNSILDQKKLNLIKLSQLNLNTKIDKFNINLRKCEE